MVLAGGGGASKVNGWFSMKIPTKIPLLALLLTSSLWVLAQQDGQPGVMNPPPLPGTDSLKNSAHMPRPPQSTAKSDAQQKNPEPIARNRYYHYSLAHIYEEMMAITGRADYATKAIDEYRQAVATIPAPST